MVSPELSEMFYYEGGRKISVFDIGPCKVGIVICYDNQFPEVARVRALRGAAVLLMPHAGRFKLRDDPPETGEAARRFSHEFFKKYALRARENACFAILADQTGRAGYADLWPRESENQPHPMIVIGSRSMIVTTLRLTSLPLFLTIPASATVTRGWAARSREVRDASDPEFSDDGSGCKRARSRAASCHAARSAGIKQWPHGRLRDSRYPGGKPWVAGKADGADAAGHPAGSVCRLVTR